MVIRHGSLKCWTSEYSFISTKCITRRSYSSKRGDPLRILFCGSDAFSSASLRALNEERLADPHGIKSIDVLCRPGKPTGRSLKVIREVPINSVAQELGLKIHHRDTFTGWNLPQPDGEHINLIVAVSFGLFVPPRILKSAKYGGINVHPSLLPQYRGPSPLHYTLIEGDSKTGVTLQTLHPESFDHGQILSQTEPIAVPQATNYQQLLDLISPVGAKLLANGVRDRLFMPPIHEHVPKQTHSHLIHAKKITPADQEIDWQAWDASTIVRRYRTLGSLWNNVLVHQRKPDGTGGEDVMMRVKFDEIDEVDTPTIFQSGSTHDLSNGAHVDGISYMYCQMRARGDDSTRGLPAMVKLRVLKTKRDILIASKKGTLRVRLITIPGKRKAAAGQAFGNIKHVE